MARIYEPDAEQLEAWTEWLAERPPAIREVAERFPPWELLRLKTSDHRVFIMVYSEDNSGKGPPVTLTVAVTAKYNQVSFERQVFGISPEDLEPCDLPGPDEPLGTLLTQDEVPLYLNEIRLQARPDLWYRGADGAVRKKN